MFPKVLFPFPSCWNDWLLPLCVLGALSAVILDDQFPVVQLTCGSRGCRWPSQWVYCWFSFWLVSLSMEKWSPGLPVLSSACFCLFSDCPLRQLHAGWVSPGLNAGRLQGLVQGNSVWREVGQWMTLFWGLWLTTWVCISLRVGEAWGRHSLQNVSETELHGNQTYDI